MRSMPTRETRTQASITMPLSRTRSRTSIRLVPPDALSTGMGVLLSAAARRDAPGRSAACEVRELALEHADLLARGLRLGFTLIAPRSQVMVVFPPVQADLLRLVDRADDQPDTDGEELHLGKRHFDVARDHQSLVQDAVEDVDEPACLMAA